MTVQHPLKLQEAAFLDESKVCLMRADSQETDLHEHEFLELTYVTRGSAQHQLGAAVMELHAGDYFLVDLGSLHSYRNGQGLEVINCLFSPAYVDRALVHCPSLSTLLSTDMRQFGAPVVSPADRVFHDSNGDILRLMEAMEREYAQRAVGYLEMIRCHLIQVLVRTIRSAAVGGFAARRHPAIAAAVDALRASYAQPFSLARLSQQLGYTPQYLSRLFHQEMGQSLSTYLQRLRVEASCQRLLASRDTVSCHRPGGGLYGPETLYGGIPQAHGHDAPGLPQPHDCRNGQGLGRTEKSRGYAAGPGGMSLPGRGHPRLCVSYGFVLNPTAAPAQAQSAFFGIPHGAGIHGDR